MTLEDPPGGLPGLQRAPIPVGHGMMSEQPAYFDRQLVGAAAGTTTEPHLDVVGIDRLIVGEVPRRVRRDVEQRQRAVATVMWVSADERGAAVGKDVFLGDPGYDDFHDVIVRASYEKTRAGFIV